MLKIFQISSDIVEIVHGIQMKAFIPLLEKYQDYDISPAMESLERTKMKIDKANTTSYMFKLNDTNVGWVRVMELEEKTYKISALCVLPEYHNRGIAQEALKQIESYYPNARKWSLDTIFQEKGNCHLYEKMGYVKFGELIPINERMSLVAYIKTCKLKDN
ncbi:GNAT family N-acetyltransferase [Clostridium lacusfryxellense]|uniref:GNAT family N-acetyltransferase n=1 Tax=Clostridium lacusfryxellense TaxID=205328 RepID=UPI001C0DCFDB|nr:GNAT family N-acetyltransferase [Clostridium lacusfryxellense]MBU3113912.1 GNAT family N-acetyltransferase [Clostridium lacusfryxellense]